MKDYKIRWERIFIISLPEITYQEKLFEDAPENAVAVYFAATNKIIIKNEYKNNIAVKLHEYGHWFLATMWRILDELWEVPWWWLGLRKLFIKKLGGGK